jgi:hypothetical protein
MQDTSAILVSSLLLGPCLLCTSSNEKTDLVVSEPALAEQRDDKQKVSQVTYDMSGSKTC